MLTVNDTIRALRDILLQVKNGQGKAATAICSEALNKAIMEYEIIGGDATITNDTTKYKDYIKLLELATAYSRQVIPLEGKASTREYYRRLKEAENFRLANRI